MSLGTTIKTVPAERRRVEAVLLDLDGTLIDSNDQHARAWVDAIDEAYGQGKVGFAQVRRSIGMGGAELVQALFGLERDDPRSHALRDRRQAIFSARYLDSIAVQPGALDLLTRLRERFTTVIATSASEQDLSALLDRTGLRGQVDRLTNSDDVDRAKPHPDVIYAALDKAGASADRCILIGDTPYDIEAARRAGVPTIALRCGGWDRAELEGALEIFDSPADLVRNWMQTPFRASLADLDLPL